MQSLERIEAIHVGHADVEQDHVRLVLDSQAHGFRSGGGLGNDVDLRAIQQARQTSSHDLMIVDH